MSFVAWWKSIFTNCTGLELTHGIGWLMYGRTWSKASCSVLLGDWPQPQHAAADLPHFEGVRKVKSANHRMHSRLTQQRLRQTLGLHMTAHEPATHSAR